MSSGPASKPTEATPLISPATEGVAEPSKVSSGISYGTSSLYFLGIVVAGVAIAKQNMVEIHSITGPAALTKPYNSFEEFYPHYFKEHQNPTCRLLHIIGTSFVTVLALASEPAFLPSLSFAMLIGYIMSQLLIGIEHGFFEFGVLQATLFFSSGVLGGKLSRVIRIVVLGYACAWVGHFFFEKNKPATFIYPTYSLLGDFTMCFRIFTVVSLRFSFAVHVLGMEPLDPSSS